MSVYDKYCQERVDPHAYKLCIRHYIVINYILQAVQYTFKLLCYTVFFFIETNMEKKSLIRILSQNSGLKALSLFIYRLGGVYIDLEGFNSSLTKRFSKQAVSKTCNILPQEKHEKKFQLTVTGQEYVSLSPFIYINTV